jgi:hypothetical protein
MSDIVIVDRYVYLPTMEMQQSAPFVMFRCKVLQQLFHSDLMAPATLKHTLVSM